MAGEYVAFIKALQLVCLGVHVHIAEDICSYQVEGFDCKLTLFEIACKHVSVDLHTAYAAQVCRGIQAQALTAI